MTKNRRRKYERGPREWSYPYLKELSTRVADKGREVF